MKKYYDGMANEAGSETPSPLPVHTVQGKSKTIGQILRDAMNLHELNTDVVEKTIRLPKGVMSKLMNDEYYTNCIPVRLFNNLLLSLHIPIEAIEAAMLPTFKLLQSKETAETIKQKPLYYTLWENEEATIKYLTRLKEIYGK